MRELNSFECQNVSAGTISSQDIVYHGVNGTISSAFNAALAQTPGVGGVITAALFGGLVAILSHTMADSVASLVPVEE
ncbi:MAG: hypothetical protein CMF48_04680 [Legionellales bacterium]|nr:hypothetical protein [Legionellales bacterium]|tara:strand:- start:196 stop:429 length:234 start_codon:yes stop_codon:yes gene_type:complete